MHILIIRLSSIGDVALATAVAAALKDALPSVRIDWLASPPAAELLRASPDIDEVLLWDRRPFDDAISRGRICRAASMLLEARALLCDRSYDVVLDIHDLFLTGLLSRFVRTKRRVGIVDHREGAWLFLPERVESSSRQKLYRYLDVLGALGIKEARSARARLSPPLAVREAVRMLLRDCDIASRSYVAVSVQSTWRAKEWAGAYYAETLAPIASKLPIVFVGTQRDTEKIDGIMDAMRQQSPISLQIISLAGRISLIELVAVLEGAQLYFGTDTGPMHIASAVGTPTLSLWGATHPSVYGSLGAQDRCLVSPYACQGCGKTRCRAYQDASPPPCMMAITPDMARSELEKMI